MIYSEEPDQRPDHVTLVITSLCDEGLVTKPPKVFAVQEIFFFEHRVSTSGAAIDPDHTQATPDSFSEIRKCTAPFSGMVNSHHIFNPNLADTAVSLNTFIDKVVKFFWNEV